MGFWDTLRKKVREMYKLAEKRGFYRDVDSESDGWDALIMMSGAYTADDVKEMHRRTRILKEKEAEKYNKPNRIKSLFKLKDFDKGVDIFKEDSGLRLNLSDIEQLYLKKPKNSTKLLADVYSKAKMIYEFGDDTYNTTSLTDEDKKEILKEYSDEKYITLTKELYRKLKFKNKEVDSNTLDLSYALYLKELKFRESVYGSPYIEVTLQLNKRANDAKEYASLIMSMLLKKQIGDQKQLAQIEQKLNDIYVDLVTIGHQEAELYQYPLAPDEAVAHQRKKSVKKDWDNKSFEEKLKSNSWGPTIHELTETEYLSEYNPNNEQKMNTFVQDKMSKLLELDKLKIKEQKNYNVDDTIAYALNVLSGDLYNGKDLNGIYQFKSNLIDEDEDSLKGLKGFNDWRKKGYLDDLLKDKDAMEDIALTYQVLLLKQGEDAANLWLQERFLHEASEKISGWDLAINAAVGFGKDILADTAEIIGGVGGLITGVAEGIGGTVASAWNGENLGDVWTEAIGDAFDNCVTRWGSDLSTTGFFNYDLQNRARELGFSKDDLIADPSRLDFLLKGGGSGIGYFLGETGRQASHTMFSVWSGKILGSGFAKGGAWVGRALKGTNNAIRVGRRIGTTAGVMVAGSNEGIMDGIQVRDDVYKQGMQQVDLELAQRAIFETLSQNVNIDDNLALATFLLNNHVGDLQVDDGNGNITTINNLIQKDENNNLVTTLNKKQMVDLLISSEFGQQLIKDYMSKEDIAAEYEEMKKQVEHTAIRNGAATALLENYINGSLRNLNTGARANLKGAEREMRKRLAGLSVKKATTKEGRKQILAELKLVNKSWALKLSAENALHEATEEGLQNITQKTFTAVGENSIKRYIENAYDTDTWEGLFSDYAATVGDIIENAGAGLADPETYEAAILGAIGSMMGFFTVKQKGKGIKGLRLSWLGAVWNTKSAIDEENKIRRDMSQALTEAIRQKGGVNTLYSMTQTKKSMDVYNDRIARSATNQSLHADEERANETLVGSISTLVYLRDTEYGKDLLSHLAYLALILGDDFENSEMSEAETLKMRRDRAKEFLSYLAEGELSEKKKDALLEVLTWMKAAGKQVRSMEEMAESPTDAEADALLEIVLTAKQTNKMFDLMVEINEKNSRSVLGLDFVAKNALNIKSVLLLNQEERLKSSNDKLTRIAETRALRSNTMLTTEQKHSIAVLGNTAESRKQSKQDYEELMKQALLKAKEAEENEKACLKLERAMRALGQPIAARLYMLRSQDYETEKEGHKRLVKKYKLYIGRGEESLWDTSTILTDEQKILTAYDILTLSPHERAMMLDASNKDKYSAEQKREIGLAKRYLLQSLAEDGMGLINQTNILQAEIELNSEEIVDVMTNIDAYNKHVDENKKIFRDNVLNFRYFQDINKEMTIDEVKKFMDRLNKDVEDGLISTVERSKLIRLAKENEEFRNKDARKNDPNVKRGWENYTQILDLHRAIGSALNNAQMSVDKEKFDKFMRFLREQSLTLELFNSLSPLMKEQLIKDSEVLDADITEIKDYVIFADGTLHLYKEAKLKAEEVNKSLAEGTNDGAIEETIVPKPETELRREVPESSEEDNITQPTDRLVLGNKMLLKRDKVDETKTFGSIFSSFINYLKKDSVINHEEFGPPAKELLDVITDVSMSDTKIESIEQMNKMIVEAMNEAKVGDEVYNIWYDILKLRKLETKRQQAQQRSKTHRDTEFSASDRSANSATIHTESVASMRSDKNKKPIIDFLDSHSYSDAIKEAALLSLGSTGLGGLIYYVTDPTVASQYRKELGENYDSAKHLPIFTCIEVSKDFKGAIPIKSGNQTVYVAPIGTLKEFTNENEKASGISYTQAIRRLAVDLVTRATDAVGITANGALVTSRPLNWKNYIHKEGGSSYTGRRPLISEIKGYGEQLLSAISAIIKKLKVGKVGDKDWDLIYYDNGNPPKTLPIIRQAELGELKDATVDMSVAELLHPSSTGPKGMGIDLGWEIDNPILRMFYINVLKADNSLALILKDKNYILSLTSDPKGKQKLEQLNDLINRALSRSFYIWNYNGYKLWRYELSYGDLLAEKDRDLLEDGTSKPRIILRAVPVVDVRDKNGNREEQLDEAAIQDSKEIVLLDLTKSYDEVGNLQLTTAQANTILLKLIYDANDNKRIRGTGETGSAFALVQANHTVINHANGIFTPDELNGTDTTPPLSDTEKAEITRRSQAVLSLLIEGGGLVVEGPIDSSGDWLAIHKPEVFDKNRQVINGVPCTDAQLGVKERLKANEGGGAIDTVEDGAKRQSLTREQYIAINRLKNQDTGDYKLRSMWVTTMTKWITGGFKKRTGNKSEQTLNKNITFGIGTNVDLVYRHVLWTSEFNDSAERETIKKIPFDSSQTGDEYYTDLELEQQFGFHASHVKAAALAFASSLELLKRDKEWVFVTNVIKPQTTIEISDGQGNKYKVPIAGELDMLAVDRAGMLHPIDFKTVRITDKHLIDVLKGDDVKEREKTIKNKWKYKDFDSFDGYSTQINLYNVALTLRGFTVGSGYILAIPVEYPNDLSVKAEKNVKANSEYANKTLVTTDNTNPDAKQGEEDWNETGLFLEGLGLFANEEPVKLTLIEVPENTNFKVDLEDILLMAENDISFLLNNPQLAEVISRLLQDTEVKRNSVSIHINTSKPISTDQSRLLVVGNVVVFNEEEDDEFADNEDEVTTQSSAPIKVGSIQANYGEITYLLRQLESMPNYNGEYDMVDFIIDGQHVPISANKVKEYLAKMEEQARQEGVSVEDYFNDMSVEQVCDDINCMA